MSLGILFWIIMLLTVFFGWWTNYGNPGWRYGAFSNMLVILVLIAILGWHAFGAPVH